MNFKPFRGFFNNFASGVMPVNQERLSEKLLRESASLKGLQGTQRRQLVDVLTGGMLQLLESKKGLSDTARENLYVAMDNVIDALGDERALIHTYLRHVRHRFAGGEYDADMAANLAWRFARFIPQSVPNKNLIDWEKGDRPPLNCLGQFMLERMDERLGRDIPSLRERLDTKRVLVPL
ncbi:MAG: hypothetical protein CMH27_10230 [Micavibrio sp.]|nr:hypothetical protein [Micavibrio sp.]|tara:strand:+ start:342 stop:878 length:537 start_codon:yes stop_codon:yes gene_type:complete